VGTKPGRNGASILPKGKGGPDRVEAPYAVRLFTLNVLFIAAACEKEVKVP
jgi:hypothetical protein